MALQMGHRPCLRRGFWGPLEDTPVDCAYCNVGGRGWESTRWLRVVHSYTGAWSSFWSTREETAADNSDFLVLSLICIYLFIYLNDKMTERDLPPTGPPPSGQAKTRSQELPCGLPHEYQGPMQLEHPSPAFPGRLAESWIGNTADSYRL